MLIAITFGLFWLVLIALIFLLPGKTTRKAVAALPAVAVLVAAVVFSAVFSPAEKLLVAFPAMLYALKAGLLLARFSAAECRSFAPGLFIYMTAWPAFDPGPFKKRQSGCELERSRFTRGYWLMSTGLVGAALLAYFQHRIPAPTGGALGILAIITTVHLGFCDVISSLLRWAGYKVAPLFESPWMSSSLRDFWNKRWNIAFVEMNRQVFLPLFRQTVGLRTAVFIAFVLSGLLHEFAISYPAGAGFGGPLLYFLIHGIACLIEPTVFKYLTSNTARRLWTWLMLLAPVPLLFTPYFLSAVVEPLYTTLHVVSQSVSGPWLMDKLIYFAAAANFITTIAGVQVPARLNWKEQLAKVTTFNRKVFLNYYFFTGGVIAAWAFLTFMLHDDILAGNRAAGLISAVIAAFWGARVLVDMFYFKHEDWPPGSELIVGHALLTTVFVVLTAAYSSFAIWCLCFPH